MLIKNSDEILSHALAGSLNARRDALKIFEETMKAIDAYTVTKSSLAKDDNILSVKGERINLSHFRDIYVIGFGKASTGMARAVEEILPIKKGIVISNKEESLSTIKILSGSHPLPTEKNIEATEEMLKIVEGAGKHDLIIVLISGGGSSFLCKPKVSLKSLREVTDRLLKAGCTINELNTVRKHISYVKGGQLVRMSKATMLSLIISDVMGSPIEFIASGPTAPDSTTYMDAKNILEKYGMWDSIEEVKSVINSGIEGKIDDTPKKVDNARNIIIASNETACDGAREVASRKGYHSKVVSTSLSGEARYAGIDIAKYAKLFPRRRTALIFGGETTVTVSGKGVGGRNQELVLGAIKEIENECIVILSCGTDGIDGNSDAAGAIGDGLSLERGGKLGMNVDDYLRNNDSYHFFKNLGDLIMTGPTGTNVMDIQIVIKY